MFKNLLKHSLRALNRQKGYVLINIVGLSIGIACSLIILLFILHQLSYDQFYENKDRIYRVILSGKIGGQELDVSSTASPIGPTMYNEFPEVEDYTRFNVWSETIIKYNDKHFIEKAFLEVDSSFFNIFSIKLLEGNKKEVLNAPHKLVLSESAKKKMFGREDAINKLLYVGTDTIPYTVTGIMEDIPETSHFNANVLGSFMTNHRANDDHWTSNSFDTYLLLNKGSDPDQVNERIPDLIYKYVGPEIEQYLGISLDEFFSQGNRYTYYLQSLTDIHLDNSIQHDLKPTSDPKYLLIFGSIALLIIVIAAINFMNLSTAQASTRAKEVGIKKVSGSPRSTLISQFLTESILLSFFSLLIAIFIIELSLPYFNSLLETKLHIDYLNNWYTIPSLLILSIFVGLLAGSYPSFYLSSFKPIGVLKGKIGSSMKNGKLRSVLVVLQFAISIILIVGTMIMFRQIKFMLNKELGFNKEQLMVISQAETVGNRVNAFKNAVLNIPGVENITASTAAPGHNNNNNAYMMEGRAEETFLLNTNWVDYDFFDTYDIKLSSGRFFNETYSTDSSACIVNKSAVKGFNLDDPLTTRFISPSDDGEIIYLPVIGVAEDFHHESLHSKITPYMFKFKDETNNWGYISIRLANSASKNTIKEIEKVWKEFTSNVPLQYFFMDQDFDRMYKEEKQNALLSVIFAIIAILIATLGLFGLTSFTVQQRTKEIGIRRALGASVSNIFYLITKETLILVTISTLIAWPLIYLVAKNWLQNYHYRINLSAFDFAFGFAIAIVIAITTISYRTLKAAGVNPSDSLRYE